MDAFGRRFRYLRLSVTEVCNFRCTYCLPRGYRKEGQPSFLTTSEIQRLVSAFAGLGVGKVRLTGGEPTVRKDIGDIIGAVAATPGVGKVAMTTNGWNLAKQVERWRGAGLTNLNVSIDALEPEAFRKITGHDRMREVVAGLDRALEIGVPQVKANAVLMRDGLLHGFADFAAFVRDRPIAVRFIELMRTGDNAAFFADQHVGGGALRSWLQERGWTARDRGADDGPATEYEHPEYAGRLGLIAPYAPGFCDSCNRLRVTAQGKLRLCLFGQGGVDLRDLLQADEPAPLRERIANALFGKSAGHRLNEGAAGDTRNLAQFGG
ncbi:MAG TPA: GTP 3',8-cyclase MoaA [Phenylobacterium sp.]